jgi:solute carrier family 25 carnitine/acylcarnitine transporter 20/29
MNKQDTKQQRIPQAVMDCVAGSVGGVGQVLSGQPFDTIKVRLQTQTGQYSSTLDCVKKTLQNEGPKAFYKGTASPLMGVGLCVSIQFLSLEYMKRLNTKNTFGSYFMCGAFAGLTNSIVSSPVEHIRTRLQVQTNNAYNGTFDCIKKIYSGHGLSGIYKGFKPTLLREIFGYGMYFGAYEYLLNNYLAKKNIARQDLSLAQVCMFGSAAGYSMWLTCYPIDIIKSRVQTDSFSSPKYTSAINCLTTSVRAEGISCLFRGLTPCLLRAAPANAATFICFEYTMRLLRLLE